jgi:hypothetical protein
MATGTRACGRTAVDSGESTAPAKASFESVAEFGFKSAEVGLDELALRDHNQIEPRRDFVSTKNLSNQSFSSISDDRTAQLSRRGDTQPAEWRRIGQREQGKERAVRLRALVVDPLVISPPPDSISLAESSRRVDGGSLAHERPGPFGTLVADGQALAALGAPPLEDYPSIFRAHPNQKTVRLLATPGIWLERPLSLHE